MIQHPQFLGFKLGLKFRIALEGVKYKKYIKAFEESDVVYVALLAGAHKLLKKKEVIKIGQTKRSLQNRWDGTLGIFNGRKLRKSEKEDCRKWLSAAKDKEVHVWVKKAGKIKIKYGKELQKFYSTRCVEEEFLDGYYEPSIGQRLNSKGTD